MSVRIFLPAIAALLFVHQAAASPIFMGLGDIPGGNRNCVGNAISADGSTVVGLCEVAAGRAGSAFRWTAATGMVGLGDPGSKATAVSADGSVVVGWTETGGPGRAWRWTVEGGMAELGSLGGSTHSIASGVSGDGSVVVGFGVSVQGGEAFRWTSEGGMVGLGDLPDDRFFGSSALGISADGSTIVGQGFSTSPTQPEAFRWTSDTGMVGLGDLGRGRSTSVAVSADGSVVVGHTGSGADTEAFLWTPEGGMIGLGDLEGGAFFSVARAVSGDGLVVGGVSSSGRAPHNGSTSDAFIWDGTNHMRVLEEVLTNDYGLDLAGWRLTAVDGISGDGLTIAGTGINPSGNQEPWIAFVPEPSTALLFGSGLILLATGSRTTSRREVIPEAN